MPRTDCDAHYFAAPLSGRCRPKRDNHPAVRRDNISKPWRGDDRAQRSNVTREGSNLRDIESSDAQRWPTLVGAATPLDVATPSTPEIDGGDALEHAITYST